MSGLKIKPPRKQRRKSSSFIARQADRKEVAQKTVPIGANNIRIYLDDERDCPDGWVLARSSAEFFKALNVLSDGALTEISLDWHLGSGQATGVEVTERLRDMIIARPGLFSALDEIGFHSSDIEKRVEMARILRPLTDEGEPLEDVWLDMR